MITLMLTWVLMYRHCGLLTDSACHWVQVSSCEDCCSPSGEVIETPGPGEFRCERHYAWRTLDYGR